MLSKISPIILSLIILLAAVMRLYGLNWDQNQHFHPDERMITMVALNIRLPENTTEWDNILTPESVLNPKFFAYGSFPIYLLKAAGTYASLFDDTFSAYDGINLVGRFLSALFDIGTLLIIFLLGKRLISLGAGLLAAIFYALSVLPIQLSHFYAVDTPLTFFILLTLYFTLNFIQKPKITNSLLIGLFAGLALATKTSAVLLFIPIGIAFLSKLKPNLFQKHPHFKNVKTLFLLSILIFSTFLMTFFIFEPFAFIDFPTFWRQTLEQQQMTKDAFTFPYTLQYVGKIPYVYELTNIFFWGLGPILATLSFSGIVFFTYRTFRPILNSKFFILNSFFWIYFLVVGQFAIGFMRYMLPIYPLLCLFAAILVFHIYHFFKTRFPTAKFTFFILYSSFFILLLIWPLSFISIYSQPNTRNSATEWIYKNIPRGSAIAVEHWDDTLPVGRADLYNVLTLPLYDPDQPLKWAQINQILKETEYIIIASNRLYVPLQKLTDCSTLRVGRCYKQTSLYYQKLFNGSLGFRKVAEFSDYPRIEIFGQKFLINDFAADESFTVYDHPKVMIFKKLDLSGSKPKISLLPILEKFTYR